MNEFRVHYSWNKKMPIFLNAYIHTFSRVQTERERKEKEREDNQG